MPAGEPLPTLITLRSDWLRSVRHRWEAINNAWNQEVLGYNPERQRQLLSRLGLSDNNWQSLIVTLAGLSIALLLTITAWTLYHRPQLDPAQRLWHIALRRIARRQVNYAPWETPSALQRRIEIEKPELATAFAAVVNAYLATRYGASPDKLQDLREAIAQLP
jgi:hypothetical protein